MSLTSCAVPANRGAWRALKFRRTLDSRGWHKYCSHIALPTVNAHISCQCSSQSSLRWKCSAELDIGLSADDEYKSEHQ